MQRLDPTALSKSIKPVILSHVIGILEVLIPSEDSVIVEISNFNADDNSFSVGHEGHEVWGHEALFPIY